MSNKSGAYRVNLPLRNECKRVSADALVLSGRNHCRATLASTT